MKIIIDCRYYQSSGIGRYLEGVIDNLDKTKYNITLLGNKRALEQKYKDLNIINEEKSPYSFKGLYVNTKLINKYDAFLSPNYIVPFGIKIPIFVTIHDLVFLDLKEVTNNFIDYMIKKVLVKRATKKAKCIFTVSNFSKKRIINHFPKCKDNIHVTYTGVSDTLKEYVKDNDSVKEKTNTCIFVGNIKKNKGLKDLLSIWPKVKEKSNLELLIVGQKDNFRTKDDSVVELLSNQDIKFTGFISDQELFDTIRRAKFLVQPSLYEGFGLPPLEALYLGTKPICSNIEVLEEIYKDYDVEFVDFKTSELVEKINDYDYNVKNIDYGLKYNYTIVAKTISDVIDTTIKKE